jgi:hypothetical protein
MAIYIYISFLRTQAHSLNHGAIGRSFDSIDPSCLHSCGFAAELRVAANHIAINQ